VGVRGLAEVPELAPRGLKVSAAHVLAGTVRHNAWPRCSSASAPLLEAQNLSLAYAAFAAARGEVDQAVA
jgi:hypothetical protein